jgi:hypothetical protein
MRVTGISAALGFSVMLAATGSPTCGAGEIEFGPQNSFLSGNGVHELCQSGGAFLLGYTAGLWDMVSHGSFAVYGQYTAGGMPSFDASVREQLFVLGSFCPPGHVTIQQATDLFCRYLRDSPEERHLNGAFLFSRAVTKAWPCTSR